MNCRIWIRKLFCLKLLEICYFDDNKIQTEYVLQKRHNKVYADVIGSQAPQIVTGIKSAIPFIGGEGNSYNQYSLN